MPFDIAGARKAGYSDDEIADFLSSQGGEFDFAGARAAGYSSSEIIDFVGSAEKPQGRTWGEAVSDTSVQLGEGVNTILGAVPNLVAPEGETASFFNRNAEYWRDKQSDVLKSKIASADQAITAAGEDGVISQISEAASQYFTDPALAARFVTTNLPSMIPGIGAAKLAQAAALAKGATAARAAMIATTAAGATNAALNAGGARGEAFEDIKNTLMQQGVPEDQAIDQALKDSRVVAAIGGVTGFISGKTGLEKSIAGGVTKGGLRAGVGSAVTEVVGEQLEEVAPKLATNVQASQYDNRSIGKDVGRTIVETAIGSGPGAVIAGGMSSAATQDAKAGGDIGNVDQPVSETPQVLALENKPDPLISFPDGSVGRQSDVDNFIASLPENQRIEARARLFGLGSQPVETAAIQDIGAAQSVDEAIAAAESVVSAPTEIEQSLKNEQIDAAWRAYISDVEGQRQRDFEAAEQARREADIPKMEAQLADQKVEQADILTKAQGFDVAEPTAMQLAMEAARAKLEGMRQKTKQEKVQAPNELILGVDRTKPTANNTPAIADSQQAAPAVPDAVTATEQKSVTGNPLMDNPASWVIREKGTGKVVMETFDPKKVEALNTQRHEAVPAYQHLVEVNDPNSLAAWAATGEEIKAEPQIVAPSRESTLPQPMPESEVTVADAPSAASMAAEIDEKPLQSRARNPQKGDSRTSAALTLLAQNDDMFQQPTPKGREISEIVAELDPGYKVAKLGDSSANEKGAQKAWDITVPGSKYRSGVLYDDGKKVWIDVSRLLPSVDAGNKIYGIAAAYAHNNGRVFIGDPAGLSRAAYFRRTENMLSSALKFGTTDHLEPHEAQVDPQTYYGQDGWDYAFKARPIQWEPGNTPHNLRELIYTSYKSAIDHVPELKNVIYDFDRKEFVNASTGERFTDESFRDLSKRLFAEQEGRYFGGGSTLKRAALVNTLVRGKSEEGWRQIMAAIGEQLQSNRSDDALREIFYSKADDQAEPHGDAKGKSESRAVQETSGLTTSEVTRSLTRLRAKWIGFTRVNAVQSVADLPAELRNRVNPDAQTEGFYDPQTKSVYLIADNIASTSRAVWVAAHEVVGHGGLRMLKDKSVNEALNLAGQNTYIRKLADAIKSERGDMSEQIAIEEAIAETAAAIETGDFQGIKNRYDIDAPTNIKVQQGLVSRVLEAVRKFLASVMGKAEVSDAEVRELIRAQMEAVEADTTTQEDKSPVLQSRAKSQVQSVWEAPEPSKMDDVIYTMQDKQIDLRRVISAIKESVGNIADKWNPYLQEELFHGRTAKRTMDFQESELRPLIQEMRLRGVEIAEFEEYLHNRHAEERNNQIAKVNPAMPDGGSGIDTADARAYLSGLPQTKKRAYEALAKRVDAISKSTRQLLIDSGLEKPETISSWEAAYQYYVPLQREESGAGIGQGFSVRGSASKRATGSKREVINVLANLVMQRERAIVRAEKNRVAVSLYGLAIQSPNPEFWLPVNPEKATQKVADELVGLGMNPIDAKNLVNEPKQTYIDQRTGLVAERVNPLLRSGKSVMSARVGGEDRYVFFNENDDRAMRMVAAMKNLDADQLGRILSLSSKVTRYFASVNTQYNPIFGAINLLRDSQGAILNLSTTPIAGKQKDVMMHTVSALRGIYIDLRDHRSGKTPSSSWAALYEEFQREGGQTGYRNMFSNSEARTSALKDELNPDAWMDSSFGKLFTVNGNLKVPLSYATKRAAGVFNWLSDYNEAMENAVRLAAYKVGKEQGLTNQQAASMAKNLTVNFNRKGQIATQAGALYAFFNASVQGTTRLVETVRGPAGKKIVAGGLLLGSMQALLLAAAGFGDDEPPEFVKSRNIVIPVGDGKYMTIPMPLGFNLIPSISRLTTEFALNGFREPTKKLANFIDLFADTFNPIGNAGFSLQTIAPTAIDPFAALAENRDWTGKPIAKENINSMSPKPGYLRYKDTASEISKTLAYWMNIASGGTKYKPGLVSPTPDQLDYLIGQATGGVGREALKVEQTVTSGFTGEDLPPHKIPLVGRFYGDTKGQSSVAARYYDNIKMLNAHEEEIKGLKKDNGDVKGYKERNPEARLVGFANDIDSDVSELRRKKRELLEGEASKERIKMIELRITARMKRLNDRVEASQKKKAAN